MDDKNFVYNSDMTGESPSRPDNSDRPQFQYDHRSGGERLQNEFSLKQAPSIPNVKNVLNDPDMSGLVESSGILKEFEREIENGIRLGNSKSVIEALAEVEPRVADILEKRGRNYSAKSESFNLIERAFINGKAKFIKNYGPIPR